MTALQRYEQTALYVADDNVDGQPWLGYYLSGDNLPPTLALADAWATQQGSFVFAAVAPDLARDAASFQQAVAAVLRPLPASRALLWVADPTAVVPGSVPTLGLADDGSSVVGGLVAPLTDTLFFRVANGAALSFDPATATVSLAAQGVVSFTGSGAPIAGQVSQAALALAGPARGAVAFDVFLQRNSLAGALGWGCQFVCPSRDPARPYVGQWAPLASGTLPGATDLIGFHACIDPGAPTNAVWVGRTAFRFTGENRDQSPTVLVSSYRTAAGYPVQLTPVVASQAALVLDLGPVTGTGDHLFHAAPAGDFALAVPDDATRPSYELLCGTSGTEYIGFVTGDVLRFFPGRPACAPGYPFADASPVGPPLDPGAPLLDATFTTSWATVVPVGDGRPPAPYTAQPKGAALYGRDGLVHGACDRLLGHMDPSVALAPDTAMPLVPYAGSTPDPATGFSAARIEDFERQVVAPTRRSCIGTQPGMPSGRAALTGAATGSFTTTTPSGVLATVGDDGTWTKILLARSGDPPQELCFSMPDGDLQAAFQTSQLFLVVANAVHLGGFSDEVSMAGWRFEAKVGQANRYDDYADVLVVKGRKGVLYDPHAVADSLVANPTKWTQADVLGAPADVGADGAVGPPDPTELATLSAWLQRYFHDAATAGDDDLATFNAIAVEPDWTGVLLLRVDIAGLPDALAPLLAGVTAPERFNAHHVGFAISPVANDPSSDPRLDGNTSMFGLISYLDPAFQVPAPGEPAQPVVPQDAVDYDFRLLSLQVLFESSAVRRFSSYAQLTMRSLFGSRVTGMGPGGNPYATIVLDGTYQDNGGTPAYSLGTTADSLFALDNNVLTGVEVTGAQMTTRAAAPDTVAWFGLTGFLDFAVVSVPGETGALAFDVFSFGSSDDAPAVRTGLAFGDLGIRLSYPASDPADRTFAFVVDDVRFDAATSTARAESLADQFALTVQGVATGSAEQAPSSQGWLDVVTDAPLGGVSGADWYGITYQLNMGTPGDLARGVGLTAGLLTAWATTSSGAGGYKASVGLSLPGAGGASKLLSLQNVLKLSIGQLRLTYDRDRAHEGFLLLLTQIALKLLGLLKIPPSGSTSFYLFGNPKTGGRASGLGWYAVYNRLNPGA